MAGTGTSADGSNPYEIQVGTTQDRNPSYAVSGKLRYAHLLYTVDASSGTGSGGALANTDEVNLIQLPPNARLMCVDCVYSFSATQGSSTTIDVGWRAYTNVDGTAVAEDKDGLCDAMIATVTVPTKWAPGTFNALVDGAGTYRFDSKAPVTIFMTCNNAGGTYDGDLADVIAFGFYYLVD